MGFEKEGEPINRSTALTPELLGLLNTTVAAAVKEAMNGVMGLVTQTIAPALRDINKPYEDPARQARMKRELDEWKESEKERQHNERQLKENCTHTDQRGQFSVGLVRNFPDRQARGVCMHCHDWIYPKEWVIAPTAAAALEMGKKLGTEVSGRAYIRPPHKDYLRIVVPLIARG